jgi:hypothetical protein
MGRGFTNDILTLGVLAIGGYLIYTKTDWFQQLFEATKSIFADIKGGGGKKPLLDLGGSSGGGGGGGDVQGNLSATGGQTIFPSTGKTWKAVDSGKKTRNYASGGSSGTTQWDIKNVGPVTNLEVTTYVNVGSCGDEVSLKVYGPSHSGSNCCWVILNTDTASGQVKLGAEGPHPTTDKTALGSGTSIGSIKNKEVGIKLVIFKSGSGYTAIGYADTGGGWKETIRKTFSEWGVKKKTSTPHGSATIQFRTDCSGVKYRIAEAAEINPTGAATAGRTSANYVSAGQYSNSLFTVNQPLPVAYRYRFVKDPLCSQVPKWHQGSCFDDGDN